MLVGAISDIHGNAPALEAVMADMPAVDHLVCAGDVVGYNPWPADCLEQVRARALPTVMGNHDRAVATGSAPHFNRMAQAGVEYAYNQLSDAQRDWLGALPDERVILDERVKIVHGHPDDPDHYTYPEEFSPALLADESLLVLGHTHVQHAEVYDTGIVCNPGSVGQPRDGNARAAYAIVDLDAQSVDLRRVSYDIDRVVEEIASAGLPSRLGDRLRVGR